MKDLSHINLAVKNLSDSHHNADDTVKPFLIATPLNEILKILSEPVTDESIEDNIDFLDKIVDLIDQSKPFSSLFVVPLFTKIKNALLSQLQQSVIKVKDSQSSLATMDAQYQKCHDLLQKITAIPSSVETTQINELMELKQILDARKVVQLNIINRIDLIKKRTDLDSSNKKAAFTSLLAEANSPWFVDEYKQIQDIIAKIDNEEEIKLNLSQLIEQLKETPWFNAAVQEKLYESFAIEGKKLLEHPAFELTDDEKKSYLETLRQAVMFTRGELGYKNLLLAFAGRYCSDDNNLIERISNFVQGYTQLMASGPSSETKETSKRRVSDSPRSEGREDAKSTKLAETGSAAEQPLSYFEQAFVDIFDILKLEKPNLGCHVNHSQMHVLFTALFLALRGTKLGPKVNGNIMRFCCLMLKSYSTNTSGKKIIADIDAEMVELLKGYPDIVILNPDLELGILTQPHHIKAYALDIVKNTKETFPNRLINGCYIILFKLWLCEINKINEELARFLFRTKIGPIISGHQDSQDFQESYQLLVAYFGEPDLSLKLSGNVAANGLITAGVRLFKPQIPWLTMSNPTSSRAAAATSATTASGSSSSTGGKPAPYPQPLQAPPLFVPQAPRTGLFQPRPLQLVPAPIATIPAAATSRTTADGSSSSTTRKY